MALTLSLIGDMLSGPLVPSRGPLNLVLELSVLSTQSFRVWYTETALPNLRQHPKFVGIVEGVVILVRRGQNDLIERFAHHDRVTNGPIALADSP